LGVLLVICAGCASTGGSADPRYARVPTGLTLLDSDKAGRCDGSVQVREQESGKSTDHELLLKPGENATFAVDTGDGDKISWSCIGAGDTKSTSERIACPDLTSHVRVMRTADRGDVTTECYGERHASR
jgi:hypothetical protein